MQTVNPLLGRLLHHTLEIMSLCLEGEVALCPCLVGKRGGCLEDNRLVGFPLEGEPHTQTVAAIIRNRVITLQQEVPVDAGRLTPTLIDTVDGVIAIDDAIDIVHFQITLAFVAVVVEDDMHRSVLFWCDTEDGRMTRGCQLQLQMLVRQPYSIVVGM